MDVQISEYSRTVLKKADQKGKPVMAQVRYAIYVDALAKFHYLEAPHWLYLEAGSVIVQNVSTRDARNPSSTVEHVRLDPAVTVIGKSPLIGFKWSQSGITRKFQLRLACDRTYTSFVNAVAKHVPVTAPAELTPQEDGVAASVPPVHAWPTSELMRACEQASTTKIQEAAQESQEFPTVHKTATCTFPLMTPVRQTSREQLATLKMPTPVSRVSAMTTDPQAANQSVVVDADRENIGQAELEQLFLKFLQDDRNIELCKAVELIWIKSGMRP